MSYHNQSRIKINDSIRVRAAAEIERRKRIMNKTEQLEGEERKAAELERRLYYQKRPLEWIADRLQVPIATIDWSLLPEYRNHKWDGTQNPLKEILSGLVAGMWVGVEGATGTNKTFLAAGIVLWFLECFEDSMVVTIAPKQDQLELHIWKEITRLFPRFGRGKLMSLELRMKVGATSEEGWKAVGFVAGVSAKEVNTSATRAQGFHGKDMLFVFEETPGVHEAIMTAIQNTCVSPNNLILALGNPDNQFDTLHKFCKLRRTKHVIISGFDHPNVVTKNPNFIPGAQSEQGLRDMLDRYKDPENPLYLSRARGISPKQSREALIRYEWMRAACDRRKAFEDEIGSLRVDRISGRRAIGADVANSEDGDQAAICRGVGPVCIEVKAEKCPNANKFGERLFYEMKVTSVSSDCVGVDGVGVGAGTVNELLRLGAKVVDIQSGSAPVTEGLEEGRDGVEQFNNLRSQMWWQARVDLQDPAGEIVLPHDEELFADLMAPKWETRGGKIVIQSKEELKKQLGRSPNKGDAFVYWNWIRKLRSIKGYVAGMRDVEDEEAATEHDSVSNKNNMSFKYNPKGTKRHENSF